MDGAACTKEPSATAAACKRPGSNCSFWTILLPCKDLYRYHPPPYILPVFHSYNRRISRSVFLRFSAADSALSLTLLQMRDNKRTECFSHKRERESFFARCIVMEIEAKLLACTRARRYAVLRFFFAGEYLRIRRGTSGSRVFDVSFES